MDNTRIKNCACKGIRVCLLCEDLKTGDLNRIDPLKTATNLVFQYCPECNEAWKHGNHPHHTGPSRIIEGIVVIEDFLSEEEELKLVACIDKSPWIDSQSGRKKQDFGPKVNFKKRKINLNNFTGLPAYSQDVICKLLQVNTLNNFEPVELCNLEYLPERGSAIDFHYDDFWLWGERLVTINLLSNTLLHLYNPKEGVFINVPMPRRSLIVISGESRHFWMHAINRCDIVTRRIAQTYRELSPRFLPSGENEELGKILSQIALSFNGNVNN